MLIGHSGHTRPFEIIIALVLLVVAIRVALPLPSVVYTSPLMKISFGLMLAAPAVWLLCARGLLGRKRALVGVLGTYIYTGIIGVIVDPSRFGVAAAWFGLAAITGYLYFVTAKEVKAEWTRDGSSHSPPPVGE